MYRNYQTKERKLGKLADSASFCGIKFSRNLSINLVSVAKSHIFLLTLEIAILVATMQLK